MAQHCNDMSKSRITWPGRPNSVDTFLALCGGSAVSTTEGTCMNARLTWWPM